MKIIIVYSESTTANNVGNGEIWRAAADVQTPVRFFAPNLVLIVQSISPLGLSNTTLNDFGRRHVSQSIGLTVKFFMQQRPWFDQATKKLKIALVYTL